MSAPRRGSKHEPVPVTVHLPEDLAQRLLDVADARHRTPEEIALQALDQYLPRRRSLGFSGVGTSGTPANDLAQRHRGVLVESLADKSARDI